jgi:phenylpyruvate tautomerase PptA (4-oxalocrotonate tautomerase family)
MPMIDVYAMAGTVADTHQLAADLAAAVMTIEQVPDIATFRQNTAAFIHDLPAGSLSNVDGESNYVRIQVLTNAGALDRGKQLAVVKQLTRIAAEAAGDPGLASRTYSALGVEVTPRSTVGVRLRNGCVQPRESTQHPGPGRCC